MVQELGKDGDGELSTLGRIYCLDANTYRHQGQRIVIAIAPLMPADQSVILFDAVGNQDPINEVSLHLDNLVAEAVVVHTGGVDGDTEYLDCG